MDKGRKKGSKQANIQKKMYEKKLADRAREMASKLSAAFETDIEPVPVVEQSLSYNIVVIGPEKAQEEQKLEDKEADNLNKPVEDPIEPKK